MSSQASVQSIEALKEFRVALALYGEDTTEALGAIDAEVRRTFRWLQEERPVYWQEQIKRRSEKLQQAKAEVFKRKLQQKADYKPAMTEQIENLRKAEASLEDAQKRLTMVRKWQPAFKQAALEYHGSIQRLKSLATADIPSAVNLLTRIIDSLEAYLQVAPPSSASLAASPGSAMAPAEFLSIATKTIAEEEAAEAVKAQDSPEATAPVDSLETPFADETAPRPEPSPE
jgi:predicted nuclease with TOPRIM domain